MTELTPVYDNRKSFYEKADIVRTSNRDLTQRNLDLWSYTTKVATIDLNTNTAKIFGTYSTTTLRHIKEFLYQNGFKIGSKKELENMYM